MANNRELSEFGGFVSVNNTDRTVGIATTVNITVGGLYVGGIQAIRPNGTWGGSSAGIQGATGTQGLTGIQGAVGSQGTTGTQGATGSQGTTGTQGATGSQGTTGTTGPVGGSSGQVLYNSGGTATSSSNFTFNGSYLNTGGGTFSKTSNTGEHTFDNGTSDTPGVSFYTANNTNFGIDVANNELRFVRNINEAGGTIFASIDTSANFKFNSGYGSVTTVYGCRAWVNFNGSTATIRASGNVSSITRNAQGRYTVNLSNSFPDTNYSVIGSIRRTGTTVAEHSLIIGDINTSTTYTTSSFVVMSYDRVNNAFYDTELVNIAVFR